MSRLLEVIVRQLPTCLVKGYDVSIKNPFNAQYLGLVKSVTKMVTGYLRMTKVAMFVV